MKNNKTFNIKMKSKKQMEVDIPRNLLGWYHDVIPNRELTVRKATKSDINRCNLRIGSSLDPKDYFCENHQNGSLINKKAVLYVKVKPENV